MAKFRKAILKTGTYHSPDGKVEVTPERLQHWAGEFSRMKAAGQVVPIDWDHASDPAQLQPLSLEDFQRKHSAACAVGHLEEFHLAEDGQSAEVLLDVRQPKAAESAELNTCYVSPVLFPSWKDGAGNEYRDVITHVDFVSHPVDHSQGPFAPVEPTMIACALRMSLSTNIYRLGDVPMDPEKLNKPEDDDEDEGAEDAADAAAPPADAGTTDAQTGNTSSTLQDVVNALAKFNVILQSGTTADNLLDRLHAALLTAAAHQAKDKAPTTNGSDNQSPPAVVQDPGFATMSAQAQAAIAYAERQHRAGIGRRLEKLCKSGRCTPAELKDWQEKLPAVKLSLGADGTPQAVAEVEQFINHREAVPKGTFWTDEQRLSLAPRTVVDPPEAMRGELTADEVSRVAAWAMGGKK